MFTGMRYCGTISLKPMQVLRVLLRLAFPGSVWVRTVDTMLILSFDVRDTVASFKCPSHGLEENILQAGHV